MSTYVWTRSGTGVDQVHAAGCRHKRLSSPDGTEPQALDAGDLDGAQREIALAMGWDNWPEDHGAAFDIVVAPCARGPKQ